MPRYIDADAAIDALGEEPEVWSEKDEYEMGINNQWHYDVNALKSLPTADVAPVRHGEWVYGENEGQDGWYCSECHFFIPWYYDWYGLDNIDFIKDFHACPHCSAKMVTYTGAKMDEGNDE